MLALEEKYQWWVSAGLYLFIFFQRLFIFGTERDRAMNGEGAEREGDTESETGSRLWAISPEPDTRLELTDREIVTWAEVGRLTDWAALISILKMSFKFKIFHVWAKVYTYQTKLFQLTVGPLFCYFKNFKQK